MIPDELEALVLADSVGALDPDERVELQARLEALTSEQRAEVAREGLRGDRGPGPGRRRRRRGCGGGAGEERVASPIVKEGLDASAALFNTRGETIAQAAAIPIHLGALQFAAQLFALAVGHGQLGAVQAFQPGIEAAGRCGAVWHGHLASLKNSPSVCLKGADNH